MKFATGRKGRESWPKSNLPYHTQLTFFATNEIPENENTRKMKIEKTLPRGSLDDGGRAQGSRHKRALLRDFWWLRQKSHLSGIIVKLQLRSLVSTSSVVGRHEKWTSSVELQNGRPRFTVEMHFFRPTTQVWVHVPVPCGRYYTECPSSFFDNRLAGPPAKISASRFPWSGPSGCRPTPVVLFLHYAKIMQFRRTNMFYFSGFLRNCKICFEKT